MARPKKVAAPDEAETIDIEQDNQVTETPIKKMEKSIPDFDYRDLTGDSFKEYQNHLKTLRNDKHYDFVLMKVQPVFVTRYEGLKGSPIDFVGVKTKTDIPEQTTRITLGHALHFNEQIHSEASRSNGKYYLLKK